jgi:hypothetical protein
LARLVGRNNEILDTLPFLRDADLQEVPPPCRPRLWQAPE